jgi:hypothetical protein
MLKALEGVIKNNKLVIIGLVVGAVAGFWYYHEYGCLSGTCSITSSPVNSTLYGALMGALLFSNFRTTKAEKHEK